MGAGNGVLSLCEDSLGVNGRSQGVIGGFPSANLGL